MPKSLSVLRAGVLSNKCPRAEDILQLAAATSEGGSRKGSKQLLRAGTLPPAIHLLSPQSAGSHAGTTGSCLVRRAQMSPIKFEKVPDVLGNGACFAQQTAKGASGKGPRQKNAKNRQKVSQIFSTCFDSLRAGQKKASKSVKKCQKLFSTLSDNFRAAPVFRPLFGGL